MSLRPLLASRKAARAFALVLAVCLGLSIMLGAAAPESDADEVPPFRFTGRMGQGVCDTLWVWAHHLDEARQDVLTEQSLQAARRAEPAPSADDDRTPNAASSLICFLGEEVPYRQGEPADITAPDGYASTWVGTGCVSDNANTYFIGHNPGVFERVMDLEIGDKITVFDDDGASRTYYVFDTLFLPNGSNYFVYEGRIAPTGETITLQTCTGDNQRVRCVMARERRRERTSAAALSSPGIKITVAVIERHSMRGGVAELAYAADLKSASSDCGFESHRPYHQSSRAASKIMPWRMSDSLAV